MKSESISILNSLLIISNSSEKDEAALLGFHPGNGYQRNVELWKKRKSRSKGGETELEWDSNEALIGMKGKIEYYLKAKNRAFLSNDKVIFIEDSRDEFLNSYIQKHLARISEGISKKNMQLIYFPAFHLDEIKIHKPIFEFIRYRLPIFYSLSDNELEDAIQTVLQKISPQEFYRIVLDELELPFFPRPCLLRNIYGGMSKDKNKFTYKLIEYKSEDDLDKFFDWYINQVSIPNDHAQFSAAKPPAEYDADWNFGSESKEDTAELKQKIDSMKAEGKFGVLAEAIMYMLETIKDEKPEILSKVRPLIEKRKLLESKVVLSPILINKHYNIFLPDFGNIEVKMHALPKTVYILFLRHPKGIRFKELFEHKKELLEIYNMVTNKYEKDEIERAIDDLVDMTKPNINMQCSRIRASFRNFMDEHIAKHYYIDGLNGEPKGIALPKNLIDIRY